MCGSSRIKFLSRSEGVAMALRQSYFTELTPTDCRVRGVRSGMEFLQTYIDAVDEFTETERELITSAVMHCDRIFRYSRAWRFVKCTAYGRAHTFEDIIVLNDCNNIYRVCMHERIHVYQRYLTRCVDVYKALGYTPFIYNREAREHYRLRANPDADAYIYKINDVFAHAQYKPRAVTIDDVTAVDHPNELAAYALVEFLFDGRATDFQLLLP